jgi:antitoxin MazE
MIEKYNIKDTINVIPEKEQIVIKPVSRPRNGWEDAFMEMNKNRDDKLLIDDFFDDEIQEKWK